MFSLKKSFAVVSAALAVGVMAPAQALPPAGQVVAMGEAIANLRAENWEPVVAAAERVTAPAQDGTVEGAQTPSRKMFMIFNQKGSDKWVAAMVDNDRLVIQAEGKDMKLLPLEKNDGRRASYKLPGQVAVPLAVPLPVQAQAGSASCVPADKMDEMAFNSFGGVKVLEGSDESGAHKMSFFAGLRDQKWLMAVTSVENKVTCVRLVGEGYHLNGNRQEFVPEWKRNIMKP